VDEDGEGDAQTLTQTRDEQLAVAGPVPTDRNSSSSVIAARRADGWINSSSAASRSQQPDGQCPVRAATPF
jgi:hypothetical protein